MSTVIAADNLQLTLRYLCNVNQQGEFSMPLPMRDRAPHISHELNPVDATDPYGLRSRKFKNDLVKPIEPPEPEPLELPIVERVTFNVDGQCFEDRFDRLHRHSSDSHPQAFGATKTRFDLDDDLNRIPGSKRKLRDDVFELGLDPDDDL